MSKILPDIHIYTILFHFMYNHFSYPNFSKKSFLNSVSLSSNMAFLISDIRF